MNQHQSSANGTHKNSSQEMHCKLVALKLQEAKSSLYSPSLHIATKSNIEHYEPYIW